MRIVSTFHPPSSASSSVRCRLTSSPTECLVIAKTNRLEVYSIQPEGLRAESTFDIWGRVLSLRTIPAVETGSCNILALTDHPDVKLIVLGGVTDDSGLTLVTKGHVSLQERGGRVAEFVTDVFVHPGGEVAVVSCYAGMLKVVQFKEGNIDTHAHFDVSIPEMNILALNFLHSDDNQYILAIVNYDHQRRVQLLSRKLDLENYELDPSPSVVLRSTQLSSSHFPSIETPPLLVPILPEGDGGHLGGVLVLGGRKILFFEHTSKNRQQIKRWKQIRLESRLSSKDPMEVAKAREKEKERDARKVKPKFSVKWPWSDVTAWCPLDEECRRFLVGDAYGRLALLVLDTTGLIVSPLGETSPPTTLSYLDSQVVYVGSHMGNPQLLRIHTSPIADHGSETLPIPLGVTTISPVLLSPSKGKGRADDDNNDEDEDDDVDMSDNREGRDGRIIATKGQFIEVLDTFQNMAPIMDAVLADLDDSGQSQIITCSGGRNSGALKVVRAGADFQELARVNGITGITSLWPVRSRSEHSTDSHLVASTETETYVFKFDSSDVITQLDSSADEFITTAPTLAVANIPRRVSTNASGRVSSSYVDSSLVIQVTPEKITLLEYGAALGLFSLVGEGWDPKSQGAIGGRRRIVAADVNASQIVVGLDGGKVCLLNLADNSRFQVQRSRDFADPVYGPLDVSAVSCVPFDRTKNFATNIAVAFWGTNKVQILSMSSQDATLATVCEVSGLPSLPRSVLLHNFGTGRTKKEPDYHPHVLVGLVDGSVISFKVVENELKEKKVFSLGIAPVSLSRCEVDDKITVFAVGSRTSVLYWDKQRLTNSPVMIKDMTVGASLNTSYFRSSLVLAASSGLIIGTIRGVDKMQIRSIPFGLTNPRWITYHSRLKLFGVGCNHTMPLRLGEFQGTTSSFKIVDATTFDGLWDFELQANEEVTSVMALPDGTDGRSPSFCVGTAFLEVEETEPRSGRLLLFAIGSDGATSSADGELRLVATQDVKGCVFQITSVNSFIAAAISSNVVLFALRNTNKQYALQQVADWNHNYFVTNLASHGDLLIVGDAISSVSLLRVSDSRIECLSRDYGPLRPVAVEATAENQIIGANSYCNLFSFALQHIDGRKVLERDGSYHLDDIVKKFVPGGLVAADSSTGYTLRPRQLFFSSSGRIGVIIDVDDELSLPLTSLQMNMAKRIKGPGDTNHTEWRAPTNARGRTDAEASAFGFLDGDFIEQFLTHPRPHELLAGDIEAERITLPQAQIQEVLEKLQSLH
ncbi:hypothetical protein CERSUDRAFT_109269 [Gelatoporia subvermispora B]|uniref:DNA damage-binding protein 1 n=1 Tax=Ceriporiopsis subvermispora (strain B) TaxID=914234 RepID=M2QYT1_CERS8|nr:hypothetical protein CERSUDRAFT_109269 [Gelatoporia subvermispora B]